MCGAGFTPVVPWPWAVPGELCDPDSLAAAVSKQKLTTAPASPGSAVGLVLVTRGTPKNGLDVLFLPPSEKPLVVLLLWEWVPT